MREKRVAVPEDDVLRFEMRKLTDYSNENLLGELRRVSALSPDGPLTRVRFDELSRVNSTTVLKRFGGWREALGAAGLGDRYGGRAVSAKMRSQWSRNATEAEMVAELQRVAGLVSRSTITRAELLELSDTVAEKALLNRFGSWKAALTAAGLELSSRGRRWSEDDYYDNLLAVWTHHGRQPTYAEMNKPPSQISNGGYASKFGTWGHALEAFVQRVNQDVEVAAVESSQVAPAPAKVAKPRREDQRSIPVGLRYQVLRRDRFRCVACGRSPATDLDCVLLVDHIVAFSRGGKTRLDNLRSTCADCNLGKSDGS